MTKHKYRITAFKFGNSDRPISEERIEYDCMKSRVLRAKAKKLLKKILANGETDQVYAVCFSNETLGLQQTISGYNGKVAKDWDID